MPDITMCAANNCKLSSKCYRHKDSGTKPNPFRQSYSDFGWQKPCKQFWDRSSKDDG